MQGSAVLAVLQCCIMMESNKFNWNSRLATIACSQHCKSHQEENKTKQKRALFSPGQKAF